MHALDFDATESVKPIWLWPGTNTHLWPSSLFTYHFHTNIGCSKTILTNTPFNIMINLDFHFIAVSSFDNTKSRTCQIKSRRMNRKLNFKYAKAESEILFKIQLFLHSLFSFILFFLKYIIPSRIINVLINLDFWNLLQKIKKLNSYITFFLHINYHN